MQKAIELHASWTDDWSRPQIEGLPAEHGVAIAQAMACISIAESLKGIRLALEASDQGGGVSRVTALRACTLALFVSLPAGAGGALGQGAQR